MSLLKGEQAKVVTLFGMVTVPSGARSYSAYLARPDMTGQWPTVMLLGDTDVQGRVAPSVKEICRRLARQGFSVLAPGAIERHGDLDVFVDFIVNPAAVWANAEYGFGVVGFGPAGANAPDTADRHSRVLATATVAAIPDVEVLARLRVPMLGLIATDDDEESDELAGVREAAPHVQWVVYRGVSDDWWDDAAPGFEEEAAGDAFTRMTDFFAVHLPPVL